MTAPRYWRTGSHWGRTIIREGVGEPDGEGRRFDDELVGVALTEKDGDFIVMCVNLFFRRYEANDAV